MNGPNAPADERASVETYASTLSSQDDLPRCISGRKADPTVDHDPSSPRALPATPSDFALLFPSNRKLSIRHDQSSDSHLNLRLDTDVDMRSGRTRKITLFHLRMYDIRTRGFSLRRYCRDSGREVCHTFPKRAEPFGPRRQGIQRSMTTALAALRTKSEPKTPTFYSIQRHDSGYGTTDPREIVPDSRSESAGDDLHEDPNTDIIRLEFSNYAHVDVKRRSTRKHKRYDFEFWGRRYAWKRRRGSREDSTFYLCRPKAEDDGPIAEIVLDRETAEDSQGESFHGGWIPPSSLRITHLDAIKGLTDVSDVIVASGLIALVDDSVQQQIDSAHHRQHPLSFRGKDVEHVSPKHFVTDMLSKPPETFRATSDRRPRTP